MPVMSLNGDGSCTSGGHKQTNAAPVDAPERGNPDELAVGASASASSSSSSKSPTSTLTKSLLLSHAAKGGECEPSITNSAVKCERENSETVNISPRSDQRYPGQEQ